MSRLRTAVLSSVLLLLVFAPPAPAAEVKALVASMFRGAFESLARRFEDRTGISVAADFGPAAALYAQALGSADADLFLSSDEDRPATLNGRGLAERPVVYARSRIILWTGRKELGVIKDWKEVVVSPEVGRIAVPSPESAPYGSRAVEALMGTGLMERAKTRILFAPSPAEAFRMAIDREADAAFLPAADALSAMGRLGWPWLVPEAGPIIQSACVLTRSKDPAKARTFLAFILSEEAGRIMKPYGFVRGR